MDVNEGGLYRRSQSEENNHNIINIHNKPLTEQLMQSFGDQQTEQIDEEKTDRSL